MNNPSAQQYINKNCLISCLDMITAEQRRKTFKNWKNFQNPEELVKCGFFYQGKEDLVTCFYCGVTLGNWLQEDDPWIEHARWSGECPYLLLNVRRRRAKYIRNKHPLENVFTSCYKVYERGSFPTSRTTCKVCWDKEVEYVTLPCAHFSMCNDCVTSQDECPICRKKIVHILHVFIP
jgi:baculoviral IAP repeat-containing protein 7/8